MRIVLFALLLSLALPARAELSTPNAAGVTFGHMHLNVAETEAHKKLLVEVFGGTFVQKGTLNMVKFPNMLVLLRQTQSAGPSQGTVMDHFGFKVRSIAETLQAVRALGYAVQSEFTGAEGFPNAYVLGPDGVRLEIQEDKTLSAKAIPNHIHFFNADYLKLLDWYVETFSLTKRARGRLETTADAGTVNLSFGTSPTPVAPTKGKSIDHIGFEIDNLEAFAKQLESKGIKFDVPVREVANLGLKIAFLTDPAGTYIELTEGLDKY